MDTNYLVVVGVDGSEGGRRALRWAVHKAAARDGMVYVVAAWRWSPSAARSGGPTGTTGNPKLRTEAILRRQIEELDTTVPIACQIVEGRPADVLCAAARDADLLVLGSSVPNPLSRPVLGETVAECAHHAAAPVVVITEPFRAWQPAHRPLQATAPEP